MQNFAKYYFFFYWHTTNVWVKHQTGWGIITYDSIMTTTQRLFDSQLRQFNTVVNGHKPFFFYIFALYGGFQMLRCWSTCFMTSLSPKNAWTKPLSLNKVIHRINMSVKCHARADMMQINSNVDLEFECHCHEWCFKVSIHSAQPYSYLMNNLSVLMQ